MLLLHSPRFSEHCPPPGHPERIERGEVLEAVAGAFAAGGGAVREPRMATREELALVHTAAYLDAIEATAGKAVMIDDDTYTSPESYDVARLAAGATIDAARHAWTTGESAMALVRPPGHHAEPHKAMGFCFYSNIAVAAAVLRAQGAERVAIVDFDVHHGNGTQAAFYADPSVLFISSHQYPFWPGSGADTDRGSGAGEGFTLNLPMRAGAGDDEVLGVYERQALPALEAFRPDVVLVSAGYDAHHRDPLGGLRMTTAGFARLSEMLADAARRLCGGRIAVVTEGGYDLGALREGIDATIEAIERSHHEVP
ncbi:MAG: histone deacetylase [Acidimicrobiia bacterium]|nr:histone deacetylase [Acidimicrobiia bacterium]